MKVIPEEEFLVDETDHHILDSRELSETHINRLDVTIDHSYAFIYLDDDPEYNISCSMISYYVCLFQFNSYVLIMIRRFLFVYLTFVLMCYLFEVYNFNYSLYLPCVFIQVQIDFLTRLWDHATLDGHGKRMLRIFATPVILTIGLFLLLFFFLIKRMGMCESFYWNDDGYFYGNSFGEVTTDLIEEKYKHRGDGYEILLYNIMKKRLLHLLNPRFWNFFWNDCVCKSQTLSNRKDPYDTKKQSKSSIARRNCLTVIWYGLKSIAYSILLILYIIPVVSVMTELIMNISHDQPPERRCLAILLFVLTFCGLIMIYVSFYNLSFIGLQIIVFVIIDTVRNLESTIHYIVIIAVIVFYSTNTFSKLRESYLEIKRLMFEVIKNRTDNSNQEIFFRFSHDTPVLQGQRNGVRGIPTHVFDVVCDKVAPLNSVLIENLLKLGGTIFIVIVIFLIMIDYHIFADLPPIMKGFSVFVILCLPALREGLINSQQRQMMLQLKRKILIERIVKRILCIPRKKPEVDHSHAH